MKIKNILFIGISTLLATPFMGDAYASTTVAPPPPPPAPYFKTPVQPKTILSAEEELTRKKEAMQRKIEASKNKAEQMKTQYIEKIKNLRAQADQEKVFSNKNKLYLEALNLQKEGEEKYGITGSDLGIPMAAPALPPEEYIKLPIEKRVFKNEKGKIIHRISDVTDSKRADIPLEIRLESYQYAKTLDPKTSDGMYAIAGKRSIALRTEVSEEGIHKKISQIDLEIKQVKKKIEQQPSKKQQLEAQLDDLLKEKGRLIKSLK